MPAATSRQGQHPGRWPWMVVILQCRRAHEAGRDGGSQHQQPGAGRFNPPQERQGHGDAAGDPGHDRSPARTETVRQPADTERAIALEVVE